jgi:hypothetical protein
MFLPGGGRNNPALCSVFSCENCVRFPRAGSFPTTLMTDTSTATGPTPASKGLLARFFGIITAPRETFESVVAHPRWFGMLALVCVIIAAGVVLPMTTEAGKAAALDQQVRQMESFGFEVNDQQYEQMRKGMAIAPYTTGISILVFSPIVTLILAGILFAVFNAFMGGDATFKQLFSVVVHAGVISAVQQIFTGPLNFFRGSMQSATNLAVLLPMVDERSFAGRLLAMVDFFIIWWLIVLAIGLGVLYRRRTQPIAIGLLVVYGIIAVCGAMIMSSLGS